MNVCASALVDQAKSAIVYHGQECEAALRLSAFATNDPLMQKHHGADMGAGLNKLAAYHSGQAFVWAKHLAQPQEGAA